MKVLITGLLTLFICLSAAHAAAPGQQANKDEHRKALYREGIQRQILRCSTKAQLKCAYSPAVRREAECAFLKKVYYEKNREELIEEMAQKNIGTKDHQIDYFLIKRFYSVVRSHQQGSSRF